MNTCFLCKNGFKSSERRYSLVDLGKVGIIIPEKMIEKDRICQMCYSNEVNKSKSPTNNTQIQTSNLNNKTKNLIHCLDFH